REHPSAWYVKSLPRQIRFADCVQQGIRERKGDPSAQSSKAAEVDHSAELLGRELLFRTQCDSACYPCLRSSFEIELLHACLMRHATCCCPLLKHARAEAYAQSVRVTDSKTANDRY